MTKVTIIKSKEGEILAVMSTVKKTKIALETYENLGKKNIETVDFNLDQIFGNNSS